MSETSLELIEVTARFDIEGRITPLSFMHTGRNYKIVSTNRRWDSGETRHFLVMTDHERVFELVFVPKLERWYLGRFGTRGALA